MDSFPRCMTEPSLVLQILPCGGIHSPDAKESAMGHLSSRTRTEEMRDAKTRWDFLNRNKNVVDLLPLGPDDVRHLESMGIGDGERPTRDYDLRVFHVFVARNLAPTDALATMLVGQY